MCLKCARCFKELVKEEFPIGSTWQYGKDGEVYCLDCFKEIEDVEDMEDAEEQDWWKK